MKLQNYDGTLEEKMSEFDIWVTPSLGEIRDMPQFQTNLDNVKYGFDVMADITDNFDDISKCASLSIAKNTIKLLEGKTVKEKEQILNAIYEVLLLVTGKTDNNLKCQFPLLLRNTYGLNVYPQKNSSGEWVQKQLPRTIQTDAVTRILIQSMGNTDFQEKFLESYIHLIISDELYAKQLWSLGEAYCTQKKLGNERTLLSPLVVFQSRGSITAIQGHIPENILRTYMIDWGLSAGSDFNMQDVEIGEIIGNIEVDSKIKKRKYDFILPYRSRDGGAKIFIQSQFYAGDSGSVSHKVVDQTDSSREVTIKKFPQAVFIEYLDGAGYFSALNGDLQKMLAKPATKNFIQINSAPLKLRRELQGIDFITTLEIEHAVMMTDGKRASVENHLHNDGYSQNEINIAVNNAIDRQLIIGGEDLSILPKREEIVRRYCLLDVIANYGQPIPSDKQKGLLIVPGYSIYWGMPQAEVVKKALEVMPILNKIWKTHTMPFDDIQWLIEKGFVKSR